MHQRLPPLLASGMVFLLLLRGIPWVNGVFGQSPVPDSVFQKLQLLGGEILVPADADIRNLPLGDEEAQDWDFALRDRNHQREVRYLFSPDSSQTHPSPDMAVYRLVLNLCANEENSIITARDLSEDELLDWHRCDGGKIFQFPPKSRLGYFTFGRLTYLYRVGRGKVIICLLYNDPKSLPEGYTFSFRFLGDGPEN